MSPERLAEMLPKLADAADRHGRDVADIPVYCGTGRMPSVPLDTVRAYEELGVRSLQVGIEALDDLKRFADEVLSTRG
jgi:hypothetical protein